MEHSFQYRQQVLFADAPRASDDLPLGHGIHGVDVIPALGPFPVSLMDRVHPQVSRTALWIWPAPLADRHRRGVGLGELGGALSIGHAVAEII